MFFRGIIVLVVLVSISCSLEPDSKSDSVSLIGVHEITYVARVSGTSTSNDAYLANSENGPSYFERFENVALPLSKSYSINFTGKEAHLGGSTSSDCGPGSELILELFIDGKLIKSRKAQGVIPCTYVDVDYIVNRSK